ncbi:hypothetical protein ABT237_20925 [Streptomyces sp. NPDC001581]|uniref:hypothetical protein n=1 Tax=Streptomyces sp. NPDC001581 TaxID=3154386 RepID=UPI00332B7787
MNEHVNGHDPFNEKWQSPEAHMTRFSELLQGLSFVRFKYTRHKRDGSEAVVTSYHGVVDHEDLQLVATARTQALLVGLVETISPLVAVAPAGKDSSSNRLFVQLTYLDITEPPEPSPSTFEPPF